MPHGPQVLGQYKSHHVCESATTISNRAKAAGACSTNGLDGYPPSPFAEENRSYVMANRATPGSGPLRVEQDLRRDGVDGPLRHQGRRVR